MRIMILAQANSFGKIGRPCEGVNDTVIKNFYVAIKDIPRARADDFVDSTESSEVGFTDILQNLSKHIDWDRRHDGGGYGASLCSRVICLRHEEIAGALVLLRLWMSLDIGIVY